MKPYLVLAQTWNVVNAHKQLGKAGNVLVKLFDTLNEAEIFVESIKKDWDDISIRKHSDASQKNMYDKIIYQE
jgi:hypothetical protein